jgi:hypothetical protein
MRCFRLERVRGPGNSLPYVEVCLRQGATSRPRRGRASWLVENRAGQEHVGALPALALVPQLLQLFFRVLQPVSALSSRNTSRPCERRLCIRLGGRPLLRPARHNEHYRVRMENALAAAVRLVVSVGEELGQHRCEYLGGHDVFLALQDPVPSVRHGLRNLPTYVDHPRGARPA